ncbi:Lycopene beta-cyclase [Gracilaria domingensis]|nr:Lycopene beta-cyclase [Gracilaria domingensis]
MARGGWQQPGVGGEVAPAGAGAAAPADGVEGNEEAEAAGDVLQRDEVGGKQIGVEHGKELVRQRGGIQGGLEKLLMLLMLLVLLVLRRWVSGGDWEHEAVWGGDGDGSRGAEAREQRWAISWT